MRHLLWIILLFTSKLATGQLTYEKLYVDYDSVWEYKNLKVIPVRFKGPAAGASLVADVLSLSQAIKQGLITVSERGTASTENVHWLRIKNKSKKPVFISSGETVIGGRQDRMVTKDTLMMPTGGDQYIPAMCVEEGRWSKKEKKFIYGSYANPRLRKVLDHSKNQVLIWKEIYAQLDSSKIKSSTLSYNAIKLDKNFIIQEDEYLRYFKERMLEKDTSIVGIVCVSGKKILGCDIFAGTNLFEDQAIPLLRGYIEEAIAFGSEPDLKNEKVKIFMDNILSDEISQEEYCKKNGKIYRYNGKVLHLTAY